MVHYILFSAGESIGADVFDAYSHRAYPIDAFVFMIPILCPIPYYKSMPAAPSTTPTARLTGFSHLGEVKWRSHCSFANKHYIANLFPLVKVLLRHSFYLLVYTHSSIKLRCKLGNLADWHFCLGEKSMDSKIKISFAHNPLGSVLR